MAEPSQRDQLDDLDVGIAADADIAAAPASKLRDLGAYIRDQRSRAQLSLRHLAKLAGVSNPYLSQIERGLRKPAAEILQAIAKALQISSETLYVKAGILDERGDLELAILHDEYLNDRQRTALIEIYRAFRGENEHEVVLPDAADDEAASATV